MSTDSQVILQILRWFMCSNTTRILPLTALLLVLFVAIIGIIGFVRMPRELTFRIVDSKTGVPLTNVTVVLNEPDLLKTVQARLAFGWYESAGKRRVIWNQTLRKAQNGRFFYDGPGQLIAPSQITFISQGYGYARFSWTNGPVIVYEPSNRVRPPKTNLITIALQSVDISGAEGLLSSEDRQN